MKKYIILFSAFLVLLGGVFVAIYCLDENYGTTSFTNRDTATSTDSDNVLGGLKGVGTVLEVDSDDAVENPQGNIVNGQTIQVDGKFSAKDWEVRKEAGLTNEEIALQMAENKGYFAYDNIETENQQLYAEILLILQNRGNGIALCSVEEETVEKIAECVLLDHPELFYVHGYSYEKHMFAGTVQKIVFTPNYTMNETEIQTAKQQIDSYVQACFEGLPFGATDYDKVKYIYEFVILNTEYNLEAPENQNICSVFLYGQSVCSGYAKAVQYLLQQQGMQAAVVTGSVISGELHAWNLVKVNSQYYYVDATWGDASYQSDAETQGALAGINYDYLCITTADLLKTHIIDNPITPPTCSAQMDNYYVKEGLYLNMLDSLRLKTIFEEAYSEGRQYVSLRCANETVFKQVQTDLLDNQQIFQYLQSGTQTLAYTYNEEMYTYTFML